MANQFLQTIRSSIPQRICEENCIDLYNESLNSGQEDITKLTYTYLRTHFPSVALKSNIGDLCMQHFERLLSDDYLNVDSEVVVWDAVLKWFEAHCEAKKEAFPLLLRRIRLDVCSDVLILKLADHPLMRECGLSGNAIVRRSKYVADRLLGNKKNDVLRQRIIKTIRKLFPEPLKFGFRIPESLFFTVSYHPQEYLYEWGEIEISVKFSADDRDGILVAKLLDFVPRFVIGCGSRIYMFGVYGTRLAFDLGLTTAVPVPFPIRSPFERRYETVSFCRVKDTIFAVAIRNKDDNLMTSPMVVAASFHPESNTWRKESLHLAPIPMKRGCAQAAAALGDTVYLVTCFRVLPIQQAISYQLAAMAYDTVAKTWAVIDPPHSNLNPRNHLDMASHEGALYFVQGSTGAVLRYDTKEESWTPFQELPFVVTTHHVIVHNGHLIVHGKRDMDPPVFWHQDSRQWRPLVSSCEMTCEIRDEKVLRKYRQQFVEREWETAVKHWV